MKPFLILILLLPTLACSQVFEDVSDWIPVESLNAGGSYSGCGVSFYDINNDGLDDLTFAGFESDIRIFQNTGSGFTEISSIENDGDAKQVLWADVDNDGDSDLLVIRFQGISSLYLNDGTGQFTDVTQAWGIPNDFLSYHFGAAFGDYDLDGYLDLYLCSYCAVTEDDPDQNFLLRNTGSGFEDVTEIAGVSNGYKTTFGVSWMDYNKDGLPDIHVYNDRFQYANALYENNGDGTFTDVAETTFSDLSIDAMSSTVGDYNNDGWLDIYVTNGPIGGNKLLTSFQGCCFLENAEDVGVHVADQCWGAQWMDVDNDMWQDLYVGVREWDGIPTPNHFFMSNEGSSFELDEEQVHFPEDDKLGWANACGDLNNDGYVDLVHFVDWAPNIDLGLWLNPGGENNYLKIRLRGTISNRDAVGSWITCHAGGISQHRYTYCGEDYIGQDSQWEIFGLEDHDVIDSLEIFWPSGLREVFMDVPVNQNMLVMEGESLVAEITVEGNNTICEGDSVLIESSDYAQYLWSDGSTDSFVYASDSGQVWVHVIDSLGFSYFSDTIMIEIATPPEVDVMISDVSCFGLEDGIIEVITDNPGDYIIWSDGSEDFLQNGLGPGSFTFEVYDEFAICSVADTILISQPEQITMNMEVTDVLCYGESSGILTYSMSGGVGEIIIDWNGIDPGALSAGEYSVVSIDENGCESVHEWVVEEPDELIVNLELVSIEDVLHIVSQVEGGTPPYQYEWSDGTTEVNSIEATEGEYYLIVADENDCEEISEPILVTGISELDHSVDIIYDGDEIRLTGHAGVEMSVTISGLDGRVHLFREVNSLPAILSLDNLNRGAYVISVMENGQMLLSEMIYAQ